MCHVEASHRVERSGLVVGDQAAHTAGSGHALRLLPLLLVVVVGAALRLYESFSTPVIGAEDPYLHMERSWDLVQGHGLPGSYPPGFAALMAPVALLGPEAFYVVARFLPPLWGAIGVAGMYVLGRRHLSATGALGGAIVYALMPEVVFRSNILFPTALDLALLPFVFLLALDGSAGKRGALARAAGLGGFLLLVHPWVVALMLPPAVLVAIVVQRRKRDAAWGPVVAVAAAAVGAVVLLVNLPGTWNPLPRLAENAGPRLSALVEDPSSITPLPMHVEPHAMLTGTALALGAAGAAVALWTHTRYALWALFWTLTVTPFVFVDWFGMWFLPHRMVAFMAVGVAMLSGIALDVAARRLPAPPRARAVAGAVALVLVATLMMPAGAPNTWYRLYDEDDYAAWDAVAARDPPVVVTGSWQAKTGYRALTGEEARFDVVFFKYPDARRQTMERFPGLVVLMDKHAADNDLETGFLTEWRVVGRWGDSVAYAPPR